MKVKIAIVRGVKLGGEGFATGWRLLLRAAAALLLAIAGTIGAAAPAHAAACTPSITACCTIGASGVFSLTSTNITAASGADCIDIAASNVTLLIVSHSIFGSGPKTGVGINILPGNSQVLVGVDNTVDIADFGTGIKNAGSVVLIDGDGVFDAFNRVGLENASGNDVVIKDVTANDNSEQGFLVEDSQGVRILDSDAESNGADGIDINKTTGSFVADTFTGFNAKSGIRLNRSNGNVINDDTAGFDNFGGVGLWLKASSSNGVSGSFSSNFASGVYIGCGLGGVVSGTSCASLGLPPSNGNNIVSTEADFNGGDGIGVDSGNVTNSIVDNFAEFNGDFNLHDGNVGCDSNIWSDNGFFPAGTIAPPAGGPPNGCINRSSAGASED